jgi:hypothetical protein
MDPCVIESMVCLFWIVKMLLVKRNREFDASNAIHKRGFIMYRGFKRATTAAVTDVQPIVAPVPHQPQTQIHLCTQQNTKNRPCSNTAYIGSKCTSTHITLANRSVKLLSLYISRSSFNVVDFVFLALSSPRHSLVDKQVWPQMQSSQSSR